MSLLQYIPLAAKVISVVSVGLYTGGTLSGAVVTMPTLSSLDPEMALTVWSKMMNPSKYIQITLLTLGCYSTLFSYYLTTDGTFSKALLNGNQSILFGGIIMFLVFPLTMIKIVPINNQMNALHLKRVLTAKATLAATTNTNTNSEEDGHETNNSNDRQLLHPGQVGEKDQKLIAKLLNNWQFWHVPRTAMSLLAFALIAAGNCL